ncbi:hypothetical protein G9A89_023854 [Geosiphon pyriformis]|nr:hypothetical protein G9A89_023854 [Geosiphon pyriformis]
MNQLGCRVDCTVSMRIITANGATKTPIGEIDDFSFEVNEKWNNKSCLACEETLLNEGMWNNISGQGGTYDTVCQYTILISDWVRKRTLIEAVWKKAIQQLDSCPHDDDKIWRMAIAKIKKTSPKEIRMIKNNPPESIELNWNSKPVINLLDPKQFYKHYQELVPTREKQAQCLEEINT